MLLKIATTGNATIYEVKIHQITLPSEMGMVTIYEKTIPSIIKLVPGVIEVVSQSGNKQKYGISKGIALVGNSDIKVTVSMVTEKPLAKLVELRGMLQLLELKLQKVKTFGSVEEISHLISEVEKVKADIQLAQG